MRGTLARSNRTPGGWGAEESGIRSGPGLEATVRCFAAQLVRCLAEMGPYYDSINEAVSDAARVAGEAVSRPCGGHDPAPAAIIPVRGRACSGVLPRTRPLRPFPSGA